MPGGGAFYLGEFRFRSTATGPLIEVTHEGQEPKLADKLQHADLQWKRLPVVCPANPREILRIDPGQTSPGAAPPVKTS